MAGKRVLEFVFTGNARGVTAAADEVEGSLGKIHGKADDSSKSMSNWSDKISGLAAVGLTGLAAAGALGVDMFFKAMDKEAGQHKLGAQLGLSPELTKAAGAQAGELYAAGYGGSLDDVNSSIRFTATNIGGLGSMTKEQFAEMNKAALGLSDIFGQDLAQSTAAVGQMIKNGLVKNGQEGFDLLTRGMQLPVNKADDLLDTFNEYGTEFRALGLSGAEAMGLMSQAVTAGARDSDTAADALKEFAIRGKDNSDLTNKAFADLGLSGATMGQDIAKGGESAQAALQLTLEKLRGIKDPVKQAELGVALFGTKAEDMQAALLAFDPATAVGGLGQVEGAAKRAGDEMGSGNSAKVEKFKRDVETNVTNFIADTLIPGLESIGRWWTEHIGTWEDFQNGLKKIGDGFAWVRDEVLDPMVGFVQTAADKIGWTFDKIGGGISFVKDVATTVADWIEDKWNGVVDFFGRVADRVRGILSGMWDGLKDGFRNALNWVIDRWNGFSISIPSIDILGQHFGGGSLDTPDIPRLHTGGTFVPPAGSSEGLALLRAGERVSTPGGSRGGDFVVMGNIYGPAELIGHLQEAERQGYAVPWPKAS